MIRNITSCLIVGILLSSIGFSEPEPAAVLVTPTLVKPNIPLPSPIDQKPTGDDAVRLQIFLDEALFGPGVIDGKPGTFTANAVAAWNERHGHPFDSWTAINTAARKAVKTVTATALVPEIAEDWVNPSLSYDRAEQGKTKRLSYRSYLEFMAERYHCDEDYLRELNAPKNINTLKPRDSLKVPNVRPFLIESISNARFEEEGKLSSRHVVVDTKTKQLRIFEAIPTALIIAEPGKEKAQVAQLKNEGLVASFPITPGKPQFIERGNFELRNMVTHPWWRYDQTFLDTGKRGPEEERINIPPGPNSPVGVIWNGTSKPGVGLHGTSDPETIGRAQSSGCIRLTNWDAIRLPLLIRPGATIEIR